MHQSTEAREAAGDGEKAKEKERTEPIEDESEKSTSDIQNDEKTENLKIEKEK